MTKSGKAEIMVIMILFHSSGYRCLKHFYLEKVCKHMRHLFPEVVSYNRYSTKLIATEEDDSQPFRWTGTWDCHPIDSDHQEGSPGQVYRYQLCGQHPSACMQEPEDTYPQGVQGHCTKGQMLHGMVLCEPAWSYRCLLYVSQEAVYQCTTYNWYTAFIVLNSSNSRYFTFSKATAPYSTKKP